MLVLKLNYQRHRGLLLVRALDLNVIQRSQDQVLLPALDGSVFSDPEFVISGPPPSVNN